MTFKPTIKTLKTALYAGLPCVGLALFACSSSMDASTSGMFGGDADAGSANSPPNGNNGALGSTDASSGATPTTVDSVSGIITVHASRNLPAFRLCFPDRMDIPPLPDDKLMPNANVVGVDVGAAVHIGALKDTATSGSTAGLDAGVFDAGDAGKVAVDSGTTSTDVVHVIEEKLVRPFYPQGSDAATWPNCATLVSVLQANGYQGHGLYTVPAADAIGASLLSGGASGVSLIVIEGCLPDPALDVKTCGTGFTAAGGNLRYRVIPSLTALPVGSVLAGKFPVQALLLSPPVRASVAAMQNVTFSFGKVSGQGSTALPSLVYGVPEPSVPQQLDFAATTPSDYDDYGFALAYGDAGLTQSLATIQAQSSPRDLPQDFYLLPSNFVVLIVGDPTAPPAAAGPGGSLHFLAVPVRDPATLIDAGTDSGL